MTSIKTSETETTGGGKIPQSEDVLASPVSQTAQAEDKEVRYNFETIDGEDDEDLDPDYLDEALSLIKELESDNSESDKGGPAAAQGKELPADVIANIDEFLSKKERLFDQIFLVWLQCRAIIYHSVEMCRPGGVGYHRDDVERAIGDFIARHVGYAQSRILKE